MSTVPRTTNTVSNLPFLLARPNSDYVANVLVAKAFDSTVPCSSVKLTIGSWLGKSLRRPKISSQDMVIAMTNATRYHLEQDLACFGFLEWKVLDLQRLIQSHDDCCLVSLGKAARHLFVRFGVAGCDVERVIEEGSKLLNGEGGESLGCRPRLSSS